jgi:two-component system, OmpR family, alkaline phosphatase synthesis response regulator PhoP
MPKRILIIDDQPFMIKLIQYNLKINGYDTYAETNGLNALKKIDEIAPDLVVLDIRMPEISGTELCAEFRKKKIMLDIPIIILTGQLQIDVEESAKAAGATDFMTKPFSPKALIAKIEELL